MNKTLSNLFKGDKVIWMVFFFLCIISIIEVFSASSTLTYGKVTYWGPVFKHCGILLVGIILLVITSNINCKYFRIATPFLLGFSLLTLLWVLFAGQATNDAQRWVSILGIQFQPSEIAKGALVLAVAQILSAMQTPDGGTEENTMKYILIACGLFVFLIGLENLSTAMLITIVIILMMFIGKVSLRKIGKLLGVFALFAVAGIMLIMVVGTTPSDEDSKQHLRERTELTEGGTSKDADESFFDKLFHRAGTWKGRILKFINSGEVAPENFDLDKDRQVGYANVAIATSNIIGKGPGNSEERDYLPQAYSDFIYAIIIEEMGIEGAFIVAALYIFLLFRAGRIAARCKHNFPAFLVMGLALLLVVQALFNMLVAVGLAPVTGQPLPLISKGGTSSIINCIYIGMILSVSRSAKKKESGDKEALSVDARQL